jgi:hypothetical protein
MTAARHRLAAHRIDEELEAVLPRFALPAFSLAMVLLFALLKPASMYVPSTLRINEICPRLMLPYASTSAPCPRHDEPALRQHTDSLQPLLERLGLA